MNVTKSRAKNKPSGPAPGTSKPEPEFDDLENWEDSSRTLDIADLPVDVLPETDEAEKRIQPLEEAAAPEESAAEVVPLTPVNDAGDDEFSPVSREAAVPVSLRPSLKLSKVERIGLIALLALLLGGGATVFLMSLYRLPVEVVKAESKDFPIKGDYVTITSATSYWRPPIREGPDADTFRRGTELLPVLELAVSGGPAAIRILFRSEDQTVVGDGVTRMVRGTDRLKIPATAGFDDLGMHAAYRTGESKPWTVEVYEARSENSSGKDLKKLFEMNVSTDRR